MTIEECKDKIKGYTKYSKDSLEIAINIIESDDKLNNIENKELDILYKSYQMQLIY